MKLRFGMVGGGNKAFIGDVHRRGATMDNLATLEAGCFTRNPEKNLEAAAEWGIQDTSRVYCSYEEMAIREASRDDGIDFVSIVTPNDTHFPIAKIFMENGIHVVCDKPLAMNVQQGEELKKLAEVKGLLFGMTYTYTGYAIIRQARELIDHGAIGNITHIMAEYPQEWLLLSHYAKKSDQALWRLDPVRAGGSACCADIGTHLECLISRITGLKLQKVLARFNRIPKDSVLEHDVQIMLDYENGIPGFLWASQVSAGHECDVRIRVYGDAGSLEWFHGKSNELRVCRINEPIQTYTANRDFDYPESNEQCRLPAGHSEGFYEAFGNIYRSFCIHLLALKNGGNPGTFRHPTLEDGLAGLRFVEACIKSNELGNIWVHVEQE